MRGYIARVTVLSTTSALLAGIPVQILEVATTASKSTPESSSRTAAEVLLWLLLMLDVLWVMLHRSRVLWRMVLLRIILSLRVALRAILLSEALIVVWWILSNNKISQCAKERGRNKNKLTVGVKIAGLGDPIRLYQRNMAMVEVNRDMRNLLKCAEAIASTDDCRFVDADPD